MKRRPQCAWSGLISKLGFEIAGPRTPVWHRFSSFVWLNSCPTFRPSLRIESFSCKLETTSIDYFCFLPKIQLIPLNVCTCCVHINVTFPLFPPIFLDPDSMVRSGCCQEYEVTTLAVPTTIPGARPYSRHTRVEHYVYEQQWERNCRTGPLETAATSGGWAWLGRLR